MHLRRDHRRRIGEGRGGRDRPAGFRLRRLGTGIAVAVAAAVGRAGGVGGDAEAESKPAAAALTDSPPVHPAAMEGLDLGPACDQCGGMMQRTGSCYTCSSCGNNTGCG